MIAVFVPEGTVGEGGGQYLCQLFQVSMAPGNSGNNDKELRYLHFAFFDVAPIMPLEQGEGGRKGVG